MLPAALFAQRRSAIEVGGFGRFTIQPDTLNVDNVFAGGGRLGYYIWQGLSVEGEASFGVSNQKNVVGFVPDSLQDVSHTLWQVRLLYNTPRGSGRTSFLVGAGYAYDGFGRIRLVAPRGNAVSGLLGLRWYLTNRISARFEANGYYTFADDSSIPYPRKATFTPNFQVGLSGLFRNAPSVPTIVTRYDTVRVTQVRVDTVFRARIDSAMTPTPSGPTLARGATIVIGVVNFDFNKYDLSSDARRILDDVSTSLARPEAANLNLVVTGNTDAIGGESYNNRLGENRAKAVADYLTSKGVAASRITQRSAGEGNPVASNSNPEGRATNRRVLIELQNGAP
jgi:outer membrane protein OmpA-like peptidoglycan-associated protein